MNPHLLSINKRPSINTSPVGTNDQKLVNSAFDSVKNPFEIHFAIGVSTSNRSSDGASTCNDSSEHSNSKNVALNPFSCPFNHKRVRHENRYVYI